MSLGAGLPVRRANSGNRLSGVPSACSGLAQIVTLDKEQQTAAGIAWFDIGVNCHGKLVLGCFGANAIQGLVVLGVGFPTDGITHTGFGHQIAFVSRIDEHAGAMDLSVLHHNFCDSSAILLHRLKALLKINRYFGLIDHLKENVLGNVWFERPHGGIRRA